MKNILKSSVLALAILACISLPAEAEEVKPGVKVGFAERDISPKIGMEQPGGYGKAFHAKLHDPCKVRASVFDDGKSRVALVGVDLLVIPRDLVLDVRREVEKRCGIAGESILIGASHTHSGGPAGMIQPGEYDKAEPLVKKLAHELSSAADPEYLKVLRVEIVEAIVAADAARQESNCGFGSGIEDKSAYNRRFRMKNGLTFTHPGQGNPDIVEPAGPTDPQVGVIGVWDAKGKPLGAVVNFACHCTTGPGGVSADYVYYLEQTVRGAMGPDAVVVFLNGASGDVTQVDNLSLETRFFGEVSAKWVGGRVGAEAVKVLRSVPVTNKVSVAAASTVLKIARRAPDPDRLSQARRLVESEINNKQPASPDWVWAKETVMLDAKIKMEPIADVEVQAVQVGPAVFVTTPAEYFCQYGLDIKKASKFPFTYPVSLANGCVGYVPTEEAFGPNGGGYETRLTSYSNLEITAGRRMADTGIELTKRFTPDALAPFPAARPFTAPWAYGNVPPQQR